MFKFFFRYFHDIEIAVESIVSNKLKSMLTALGIIFGVAAVIAMLAIGKGAKQEIMEQMKMVGVNNILINPIVQDQSSSGSEDTEKQTKKFSRGLSMLDVEAIKETLPSVKRISPEISFNSVAMMNGVKLVFQMTIFTCTTFRWFQGPSLIITRRRTASRFALSEQISELNSSARLIRSDSILNSMEYGLKLSVSSRKPMSASPDSRKRVSMFTTIIFTSRSRLCFSGIRTGHWLIQNWFQKLLQTLWYLADQEV